MVNALYFSGATTTNTNSALTGKTDNNGAHW